MNGGKGKIDRKVEVCDVRTTITAIPDAAEARLAVLQKKVKAPNWKRKGLEGEGKEKKRKKARRKKEDWRD